MARSSFDVHVQEIVGTLIVGATVIMLRPHGSNDLEYFLDRLIQKQVTYIQIVPAFVKILIDYLQDRNISTLKTIRTIDIGGKYVNQRILFFHIPY